MRARINNDSTTTKPQSLNEQQPKPPGGLKAFYWHQTFDLDSAVQKHKKLLDPMESSLQVYAMYYHRETVQSNKHTMMKQSRLRAKKGPAPPPPLGNFADIFYLDKNFKPHLFIDVCTLCSGALVSDSL